MFVWQRVQGSEVVEANKIGSYWCVVRQDPATKGRGAVMVMVKGTGLTIGVASMPRFWVLEDMEIWVT